MTTPTQSNWQKNRIHRSKSHQYSAHSQINGLTIEKREGRKMLLSNGMELVEFSSCSYLGLDTDSRLINALTNSSKQLGITFPVSRTRMISNRLNDLEAMLNTIFCNGHSVIFTSLHLAHLGIIPMIASGEMPSFPLKKNGPSFILDYYAHASFQINRGLMQQFGQVDVIDFQDLDAVEALAKKASKAQTTPIFMSDSIGSMGGVAPQDFLFELAEKYEGYVYLDDAHGTSAIGKYGCGYVLDKLNTQFHPRLILAASLSKGFGCNGGAIVFPAAEDVDLIKKFAPNYIFSNPPATPIIDASIASATLHMQKEFEERQAQLQHNLRLMDTEIASLINYGNISPIRGLFVGDERKAIGATNSLMQRGFIASAAMYPTVEYGKSIIRFSISSSHTDNQIKSLCSSLKNILSI